MIREFRNQAAVLAGLERSLNGHFGRIYGLIELSVLNKSNGSVDSVTITRLDASVIEKYGPRVGDDVVVLNIDSLLDLSEDLYMNIEDMKIMLKALNDDVSV